MVTKVPKYILPVIVFAQFTGTSLWFAGNAVVNDLIVALELPQTFIGIITMAVQAGFILGTLVFAILNIADRFSPVRVFLFSALAGALANLSTIWAGGIIGVVAARFMTGIFLAGIYPVGMKIASDWHKNGLGKALGYLVGALVLGTAFPHLLKFAGNELPWRYLIAGTSLIASSGGLLLIFTVKDGPYRASATKFNFNIGAIAHLFKNKNFRASAFGYLGHMWELYTFWAFVPVIIKAYLGKHTGVELSISLWSFFIIGIGSLSCVIGGYLSLSKGSKWVSMISLLGSGIMCLLLPLSYGLPVSLFLLIMLLWGIFVIPDSPQFSSLVAQSSDPSLVATALTIVNSLGFAITIISIQLVSILWSETAHVSVFWLMALGPLFGFLAVKNYRSSSH